MRVTKRLRIEYEEFLKQRGEAGFYRHVLGTGLVSKYEIEQPEVMMMDQADAFFSLSLSTGKGEYFVIGKILRRAAHKLYRAFKRSDSQYPTNARFLNVVK